MVRPKADPTIIARGVFITGPAKKVRLILTYPPSTGRNVDEILRVIDSLQLNSLQLIGVHKVAMPVNCCQRPNDRRRRQRQHLLHRGNEAVLSDADAGDGSAAVSVLSDKGDYVGARRQHGP
jgi:hypothetical protein